ncbi:MAG: NERD domain-containing protein [Henriciella sp.]
MDLGLLLLFLIALGIFRSFRSKGKLGELRIERELRKRLDQNRYRVLSDVTLPTQSGTTQIDHIVISEYGVFVIETKNMSGWIYGNASQKRWTQTLFRFKSQFQNPLHQNYKHVKTLQQLIGLKSSQLYNAVVFVGSATPQTPFPPSVTWGPAGLAFFIQSQTFRKVSAERASEIEKLISETRLKPGRTTSRRHIKNLKNQRKQASNRSRCPRCGGTLAVRTNSRTGEQFLGCEKYPRCKGTRNLW